MPVLGVPVCGFDNRFGCVCVELIPVLDVS